MEEKQLNTRPGQRTHEQVDELLDKTSTSKTAIVADAVDRVWRAEFEMSFNQACTELGITDQREQFYRYWQIVRDYLSQRHALNVWQTIHRCYEWQRASADESDTLADSLT